MTRGAPFLIIATACSCTVAKCRMWTRLEAGRKRAAGLILRDACDVNENGYTNSAYRSHCFIAIAGVASCTDANCPVSPKASQEIRARRDCQRNADTACRQIFCILHKSRRSDCPNADGCYRHRRRCWSSRGAAHANLPHPRERIRPHIEQLQQVVAALGVRH